MDFKLSIFLEVIPLLLGGAWVTLYLSLISSTIGAVSGLFLGMARVSRFRVIRAIATLYTEVIRGTPLLMQLIVLYYGLPSVGINLEAVAAGIIGLSANSAAYVGEIFRAGIQSVGRGQREAAQASGLTYFQVMRYVILPQAFRMVLPPLTNEFVTMLKDSSLVSTLAIAELLRTGREIVAWKVNVFSPFAGVTLLYLGMTLPLTHLARFLERRIDPERRLSAYL
ncbi:MAG: amino acid ABC transporter permease [candidate division NC10 bacterium]|nr:amino acid ABC transporter permease [candidate division NC10 bacterium]MBI2456138.1 amino acid ABC transporter permease [candidate division NC10 bacterium]MBI2562811.1 amino acid ABC transporter permease [candidate division NC10 bacterium]